MIPVPHAKDLVQLLQRAPLSLGDEEVGEHEADGVPGAVPAETARGGHGLHHLGPREADEEVERPGHRRGRGHAQRADVQREGLGAVGEGDGAEAGRIDEHEDVHTRDDEVRAELGVLHLEAARRPQQGDGEEGQGGEKEVAAPEAVDGQDGGQGSQPVEHAASKRGCQCYVS